MPQRLSLEIQRELLNPYACMQAAEMLQVTAIEENDEALSRKAENVRKAILIEKETSSLADEDFLNTYTHLLIRRLNEKTLVQYQCPHCGAMIEIRRNTVPESLGCKYCGTRIKEADLQAFLIRFFSERMKPS